MDYLTAKQTANKWGVSLRWVHKLCQDGRISGVERPGRDWLIPKDAQRPVDGRIKSGKCIRGPRHSEDTHE